MKWLAIGAAGVLLIVALAWLLGALLPVHHVAAVQVSVAASPESVFALIADPARAAEWRPDVKSVEMLRAGEQPRWRESTSFGELTMRADESLPPRRYVTSIDDPEQPFGGRWIFDLTPDGTGTSVRITEEGDVYNPIFRIMSRYLFGHYRTLEAYATSLARHLGHAAAPSDPVVRRLPET